MARRRTAVTGSFKPRRGKEFGPEEHMFGFSRAVQNALDEIGWPRGQGYHASVQLSAVIDVHNPGTIIEYQATLI